MSWLHEMKWLSVSVEIKQYQDERILRPGNSTSTRFPTKPSTTSDLATEFKKSVADANIFSMFFTFMAPAVSSRVTPVSNGTFLNEPLLNVSRGCSSMRPGRERSLAGVSTCGPYPTLPVIDRSICLPCKRSICTFESSLMISSNFFCRKSIKSLCVRMPSRALNVRCKIAHLSHAIDNFCFIRCRTRIDFGNFLYRLLRRFIQRVLRIGRTGHRDHSRYHWSGHLRCSQISGCRRTRTMTHNCYLLRIAPEEFNVFIDPSHSRGHVK